MDSLKYSAKKNVIKESRLENIGIQETQIEKNAISLLICQIKKYDTFISKGQQ